MMGSLSGIIQRPLVAAAAAVATAASVSVDLPDNRFSPGDTCSTSDLLDSISIYDSYYNYSSLAASNIYLSKYLSFVSKIQVPPLPSSIKQLHHTVVPNNIGYDMSRTSSSSCAISSLVLQNLYLSAELSKAPQRNAYTTTVPSPTATSSTPDDVLYRWHLPEPNAVDFSSAKSRTVVVLLGWLGAKQKHLKRYAEWYTSMGFHAITFTFPMAEVLSYQVGGKAEQHIESLVNHLADWLEDEAEEHGKNLVFHTFSNTGWLTYGAILENFQKQSSSNLMASIKGCIVDSAPVAAPDPQVWASGFSAAFLKKRSVSAKGFAAASNEEEEASSEPKAAATETALLFVLEKFFQVVLNLPSVNRRLCDVMDVLSTQQPRCPQLYIYSTADRVIPAGSVESFIEEQRRLGVEVRACNFISTPHVDHFRNQPQLYTSQLTRFLEDSVLTCCSRFTKYI